MKLFLIRHGESLANKKRKHQGEEDKWKDTPLSFTGKTQAKKVAEKLKDEKFDFIYSSPLKRAKQTAEAINKYHNQQIIFEERIKKWQNSIETKEELIQRVNEFYKELINKNKNILVVTHGEILLSMLAFSKGDKEEGEKLIEIHLSGIGNTSINILEKREENVKILELNCMNHLGKNEVLKQKGRSVCNIPYKIKPFIKKEINSELESGDCRHKTELLKQLFEESKFKVREIYAVFDWKDLPIPKEILDILKSGTKMVHHLLEVNLNGRWIKVDFTWNLKLEKKDFPITRRWNGKEDTKMVTEKKINFYKTNEEAKKEKGINKNKEELYKFAEEFNKWIED